MAIRCTIYLDDVLDKKIIQYIVRINSRNRVFYMIYLVQLKRILHTDKYTY